MEQDERLTRVQGQSKSNTDNGTRDDGAREEERRREGGKLLYMRVADALGWHLILSTKQKIWAHEYIDIFKHLHRETRCKEGSKAE